jgi:glycosyltransferase involved in cell wall biosynthesis
MDMDNPLLSHQVEAVNSLSRSFHQVTVVTGKKGRCEVSKNVTVISTDWQVGHPLLNVVRFLRVAVPVLKNSDVVFSHMTEVQTFLLSPFTKILRKPHFLWYAHAHLSKFLIPSYLMIDGFVTSTSGSFPLKLKKVSKIGQAIKSEDFFVPVKSIIERKKLCHLGRFDSSKGISEIILAAYSIKNLFQNITLTLVGTASNEHQSVYASNVRKLADEINQDKWIVFEEAIRREIVIDFLMKHDVFVHAYKGSLDKTLIEATFAGLPVVTINHEYLRIFGTWSGCEINNVSLTSELQFLMKFEENNLRNELKRRQHIALTKHSLDSWTTKLSKLLVDSIQMKDSV